MKNNLIHPTAIIDKNAELGKSVKVGAFSIIGPNVFIDDYTEVENHVTIVGKTKIGKLNTIGPYTSIGLSAQDKAHRGEDTKVEIGDENEIREYVSVQRGTFGGTGITKIGSKNQIMVSTHFAHDSSVGDGCMFANSTTFGGHVQIGSYVVTGGLSAFHQFCKVGDYAMIGGLTGVYQDIVPYVICTGNRAKIYGLNRVGLKRNNFSNDEIILIQKIINLFFSNKHIPTKALEILKNEFEENKITNYFADFIKKSSRGLIKKYE